MQHIQEVATDKGLSRDLKSLSLCFEEVHVVFFFMALATRKTPRLWTWYDFVNTIFVSRILSTMFKHYNNSSSLQRTAKTMLIARVPFVYTDMLLKYRAGP